MKQHQDCVLMLVLSTWMFTLRLDDIQGKMQRISARCVGFVSCVMSERLCLLQLEAKLKGLLDSGIAAEMDRHHLGSKGCCCCVQ